MTDGLGVSVVVSVLEVGGCGLSESSEPVFNNRCSSDGNPLGITKL